VIRLKDRSVPELKAMLVDARNRMERGEKDPSVGAGEYMGMVIEWIAVSEALAARIRRMQYR